MEMFVYLSFGWSYLKMCNIAASIELPISDGIDVANIVDVYSKL